MVSERMRTTHELRGLALLRRAVALASMLALTVPVLITTLAAPAGASSPNLSTQYLAGGPVLAGTPVNWEGTVENTDDSTVHNVQAIVSLGTPATANPTWTNSSAESSGDCTPSEGGVYLCAFGDIPGGGTVVVDATADTSGLRPQTLDDSMVIQSDESGSFNDTAPVAQQRVDGLRFDVAAPASIPAGDVLSLTGTVTNTSATEAITGVVVHGAIDNGAYFHSGPSGCTVNNSPPGATIDCPSGAGSFSLPPGASLDSTTTVNTNGLAGQSIGWSVHATSASLGGDTYVESGSVHVVTNTGAAAPTVSIASPANNATLFQSQPFQFGANATPAAGQTINFVDLQVDFGPRTIISAPGYAITIGAGGLSPGLHVLKAIAHDSDGQTALASVTVTVAAPPTVAIIAPPGFTQLDTATTFTATAGPGPGLPGVTITRVEYKVDGISVGSFTTAPYTNVIDPAAANLAAGLHTLTATAFDSIGQTATDELDFTVPQASLQVAATTAPIIDSITANGDAAWPVQVTNASGVVAHHVKLTIDATATAPDTTTTALSFDQGAINGGLNLPATTITCVPGTGSTFVCNLPDIPANSSLSSPYRVFVTTTGVATGSTITGNVVASAANADSASGVLGAVSVISCGASCVIGVAAPGDPFASNPDAPTSGNPTKQVITLTGGTPDGPPLPAVTVTLSSIDPGAATDPGDHLMCPVAPGTTHCSGQISSVVATFGAYVNKQNPIRVTIIARWGTSIPSGRILMEKDTGGDPIFLEPCVVDPVTREFNTPCILPEIVHGTTAAGNLTTYDSILFVGDDVHFARRTATGGTIITPPAAPTAVTATAGVAKATLRWVAPTVTNGAAVSGYVVTVLSGGVVQKTVPFATTALTQVITGLTGGKTYTFKVAAKNVAGTGVASAVSGAVKAIGVPGAPTGVTAVAGAAKATLRWIAPAVNNGGVVTGYVVTVLIAGVLQKTVPFATAALTQVITGLTAGKTYTFKVAAKNVAGTGVASALSNAVKPT